MNQRRQFREIEAVAIRLGYTCAGLTKRGHWRWLHPNGALVITGSDLTEASSKVNAIAHLRRHAREIPTCRSKRPPSSSAMAAR